jgi:hypothetical protein
LPAFLGRGQHDVVLAHQAFSGEVVRVWNALERDFAAEEVDVLRTALADAHGAGDDDLLELLIAIRRDRRGDSEGEKKRCGAERQRCPKETILAIHRESSCY